MAVDVRTLVAGTCLIAVLGPAAVAAQAVRGKPSQGESMVRQWELRGVAIAGATRLAVLAHQSSGQQQVLRVGQSLADGVSVTAIAEDRVVVDSAGTAVTLRIGHGGRGQLSRPPVRVRPRSPSTIMGRWPSRR